VRAGDAAGGAHVAEKGMKSGAASDRPVGP
jgi:hypothetical protein